MDLNEIAAFASVLREGSFTRAAAVVGVPKSTLSERVTRLEEHLGVRLLERTTRSLKATPAGAAYFDRVAQVVAELDAASAAVAESHRAARGLVRIGAPTLFTRMFLLEVLDDFMTKNPEVEIDLVAADRSFNVVEEGLDLAVVIMQPPENLVVTRLATATRLAVASPAYVARRGAPQVPEDLAAHAWILPATTVTPARRATWVFHSDRDPSEMRTVSARGRLVVSSIEFALQAVLRGGGITMVPALLAQSEIDAGRLVRLLPRWSLRDNPLLLVHGPSRDLPVRVRLLVDFFLRRFAEAPALHGIERAAPSPPRRRTLRPRA